MKKFFLPIAMLVMAALAFGQDSAQPPKDLSGFSGYSWGAGIEFITDHMEDEEYFLVSATCTKLTYRGEILDEPLTLVYGFENGLLDTGLWVFGDVDYESFWKVHDFLQNAYNYKHELEDDQRIIASMKDGDGWIESEIWPRGTNAQILHNLDIEDDRHEVHYYYRRGEE